MDFTPFVFLLTVWNADAPADVYVMDSGITGEDCAAAIVEYHESDPQHSQGEPSCEIDAATYPAVFMHEGQEIVLPPCPRETANNCYWDAGERGNGEGQSFYVVRGMVYTFNP